VRPPFLLLHLRATSSPSLVRLPFLLLHLRATCSCCVALLQSPKIATLLS
jgi:hypothetical protein